MKGPEEYAKDLVYKYYLSSKSISRKDVKQCALIDVGNTIETLKEVQTGKDVNDNMPIGYYERIIQEINKLNI